MMATGYVHPVADGKVTTLRDFALQCARAFGALITMRDDPMDAPIPERLEPNFSFYEGALSKARADLARLSAMSLVEAREAQAAERAEQLAERERYISEREAEFGRVRAMRAATAEWTPDPDCADLKAFMLDQLDSSLEGGPYAMPLPPEVEVGEWHKNAIEDAGKRIGRYEAEIAKEISRTAGRNAWLDALRRSLPPPSDGASSASTSDRTGVVPGRTPQSDPPQ